MKLARKNLEIVLRYDLNLSMSEIPSLPIVLNTA